VMSLRQATHGSFTRKGNYLNATGQVDGRQQQDGFLPCVCVYLPPPLADLRMSTAYSSLALNW